MNYHSFLDKFSIWIGLPFLWNKKYFRKSIESPRVKEVLRDIHLDFPKIRGEEEYKIKADSPIGEMNPKVKIKLNRGKKYPTIIYHHGNAESPYDKGFNKIFSCKREEIKANLIVVREPFQGSLKVYMEKLKHLENFVYMLATTVKLTQKIIDQYQASSNKIVSGISLGGWVTNMHRSYYNSADNYVPLLAGAKLGDLFTKSIYRKITSDKALKEENKIENILNFNADFHSVKSKNVYPLLARYDQYIEYEVQRPCYENLKVNSIDKGHLTAARSYDLLREHVLSCL